MPAVREAAQRVTGSAERGVTVDGCEYSLTTIGRAGDCLEFVFQHTEVIGFEP
jgi:hypothetical protein